MKLRLSTLALSAAAALGGCGGDGDGASDTAGGGTAGGGTAAITVGDAGGVTVGLMQLNASGVTGEATLTPARQETRVVVRVDQADPEEPFAASIRAGRCADLTEESEVAYELQPVAEEPSDTVVGAGLQTLLDEPNAIVLESSDGLAACADVAAGE